MKNFLKIISFAGIALLLNSCYYDSFPEAGDLPPEPEPEDVSYSEQIQPLLNDDCVVCHPSLAPPDLTPDNSWSSLVNGGYVIPGDANNSDLYKSLLGIDGVSLMPPNGWPDAPIELVRIWIEEGAKNN